MTNNDNGLHQSVRNVASGYRPKILAADYYLRMSVNNIYRKNPRKCFSLANCTSLCLGL